MRNLTFRLLRLSGIPKLLRNTLYKNRITILCFHNPSPEVAEKHYQALKSAYNIISLKQYVDFVSGESIKPIPQNALIVTLDDGYRENYNLLKVFKKYNIPATIFACSGVVGTDRGFWWKALSEELQSLDLESVSDSRRLELLTEHGFNEVAELNERQALSSQEIEELMSIVEIQSHTQFHPALPQCDAQKAYSEIADSKAELELAYNQEVYAIAFPNGRYTNREIKFVQQSGYKASLTTDEGQNDAHSDLFRLKRIDIQDDASADEVIVKASGAWRLLKIVIGKFKGSNRNSQVTPEREIA